jgi:hypothetical protein
MGRLLPFLTGTYTNTYDRPSYEIDIRARETGRGFGVGTEVHFSGKTSIAISAQRHRDEYDPQQTFLGSSLAQVLNHRSDSADLQFRYALTPLTTFVITGNQMQDRFTDATLRNSDVTTVMSGFDLKPLALISGTALVGYRRFHPLDPTVPTTSGVAARVDAHYAVSASRVDVRVNRDVVFSYEPTEPYYTLTDIGITLTQRVTYEWDIIGRIGWQALAYQSLVLPTLSGVSATVEAPGHVDHSRQYGGGLGYRVGRTFRVGVNADYYRRLSPVAGVRDYTGFRVGMSIGYGLIQ